MSEPSRKAWFWRPRFRSHRRVLSVALLFGTALHGGVVAYGALLEQSRPATAALPLTSFGEIALVPVEAPEESGERGGGSLSAGAQERAAGESEPAKHRKLSAVKVTKPVERPAVPPPPKQPSQTMEHGNADVPETDDLLALDELLSADNATEEVAFRLKAKPAFRTRLTAAKPQAAPMAGDGAQMARYAGTGPGRGGGSGGPGNGGRGGTGGGSNPFGGERGAFTGRVCFIEPFVESTRAIGRCSVKVVIHTSRFDIPRTHFEGGFPGVPRDEWFAIFYSGKFTVRKTGDYLFHLSSDDGSLLDIDGHRIIDNDGLHGPVVRRGTVHLTAGEHDFELRYMQGPRMLVALQLWVTPPGEKKRLFGPAL